MSVDDALFQTLVDFQVRLSHSPTPAQQTQTMVTVQPGAAPPSPVPGPSGEGRDDDSGTREPVRYKSVSRMVECGPEERLVMKRVLGPLDDPEEL
ncbi:hypothetical protein RF55_4659 [Lasius niger]|uniref:Uncharacterized protein n=1 Tax=Lasius niger TaxID=67767 RepID=A0A0J7KXV8_LASNI|nr:hypothetical protein RF55_4659 [Lasius niger]